MDAVEADNRRHKDEERRRREKRQASRHVKSRSAQIKAAKRREHNQKILQQVNQKSKQSSGGTPKSSSKSSDASADGGNSTFQSLFSKRSEGFMVELNFRNAPPRPPVGPIFVGLGLDGELNKLSKYRDNTVEKTYVFKLHTEKDLGVPLAPSAMEMMNYKDDSKAANNSTEDDTDKADNNNTSTNIPKKTPPLHPDDMALINWKHSLTDTKAELLQKSRDRKRAEAHAKYLEGNGKRTTKSPKPKPPQGTVIKRAKLENGSRVLSENYQSWMKKTTYLANDPSQSVHRFTSLANVKKKNAEEIDTLLKKVKQKTSDPKEISKTFHLANNLNLAKHPRKKNITPVYEFPLLPDVHTWGHTYTHVVLDNAPRVPNNYPKPSHTKLNTAFISDVESKTTNAGMECNFLVNTHHNKNDLENKDKFDVIQKYDLDVIPLKDENTPHVNFVWILDEVKKEMRYHPVSSRVQLSLGRPEEGLKIISKRTLDEADNDEIEARCAEVDLDLAKKHEVE